jgi:hypothetical protein
VHRPWENLSVPECEPRCREGIHIPSTVTPKRNSITNGLPEIKQLLCQLESFERNA